MNSQYSYRKLIADKFKFRFKTVCVTENRR